MFLRFGHRGAPGYPRFGENTMPSFRKAFKAGANGLETDLRKTKDGVIVLIHDKTIDRTTNGKGNVSDFIYRDLREIKTDNNSYIPSLEEFLKEFSEHGKLFLELKDKGITHQVKELITKFNLAEGIIIIAFDEDDCSADAPSSWKDLKEFQPDVKIGLLVSPEKKERLGEEALIKTAKELYAYCFIIPYDGVSSSIVKESHEAGIFIFSGGLTIKSRKEVEDLKSLGVDGFFSDLPELIAGND